MAQDYYAVKIAATAVSSLNFSAVQSMTGYIGPKEPGSGLISMYMGSNVSDGGDEQANSRGNVIIGPSAGAANGDDLVGDETSLPPTDPDPTAIFDSVIIGAEAGSGIKRGVGIVAIGRYSTQSCVRYGNNTAVGDSSLRYCETGGNSAFGYVCLEKFTTGQYNNGFGLGAGTGLLTGSKNCYFGNSTGASQTTNDGVCAFGYEALYNNLGGNNCAFGTNAGRALVNGSDNIFIGDEAGSTSTSQAGTCTNSIVVGSDAFALVSNHIRIGNSSHTTGQIFGTIAMHGAGNVATNTIAGLNAALSVSGASNTLYGVTSGYSLLAGYDNTGIGIATLYSATSAYRNTAVGVSSLLSKVTGYGCTSGGWGSGILTTGDLNTYWGYSAGAKITTGTLNTFIGNEAGNNAAQLATATNSTAIGSGAYTTASNQVVIGDTNVTSTVLRGAVTTSGELTCRTAVTTLPAGGGLALSIGGDVASRGIYWGSGAPSAAAAQGSLYLRSDGSTTNDRMYVNTDGSTTWTAVTTSA